MERRKTGNSLLRATGVRPVVSRVAGGVLSELRQPLWKRTIDIVGSIVGLIVLSPVVLFAGIVIRLVSPGPPFFGQQRVGYQGKRFTIWKLRTMHADVDDSKHQQYVENLAKTDGLLNKLPGDCQVVRFGSFFRKLAIDELPQLFNVLRGDMSLVGPRPDVVPYEEYNSHHRRRFEAVPGMTGLWQVTGKNRTTFSEMVGLDIEYVERRSFWLDTKIVLMTMPAIIRQLNEELEH